MKCSPALLFGLAFSLGVGSVLRSGQGAGGTDPAANFLGRYGNDDTLPASYGRTNASDVIFLPPERAALGGPKGQQKANVFVPPGPAPRDGWPVVFMTLYGGGNAVYPVTQIDDGGVTDRLWEAVNAGLAVVNWGAPPVSGGRGMFYPPGHPSGRYESFLPADDNNYKDAEWVIQYFKQPAQTSQYNFDVGRFGTYASSQGSLNTLWATVGPERARSTGSAQVQTSTRVAAVVAIGSEGTVWAYDQGPTLGTNVNNLFERADMPGVPSDELSQVDEQLQKDGSLSRWMTQSQDALDNNAQQPFCFLYVEPVKMVNGQVADTSLDAFGDPVLHDTIGQPYIHDSWNMIIHVNKLLNISQESYDFHLTEGNSVFALEESVAATLAPPFDVFTETYTGPIFSEEQTRIGVNFLRRHLVLPLRGDAPLRVLWTDESEGSVDTWLWDFGDGTTSSSARPVHTYAVPGTFDVSLTVTGPSGTSTKTRAGCVVVGGGVAVDLADGGFEGQSAQGAPAAPWVIQEGSGHRVQNTADGDFPTEGSLWLDLSSLDTKGALPPSNPGGAGAPGVGGAGVGQSFTVSGPATGLRFDAAFVRAGSAGDPLDHDWMSVDITDGQTSWNLFLADSNTPTPKTSLLYGLPQTDTTQVRVDLATLFGTLDASTVLTLTLEVGDGGDGSTLSHGYLDGLALFVPAAAVVRNGSGINPTCFLNQALPILGANWVSTVDTSNHPGATLTAVVGYDQGFPGLMTPFGELLVATEALGGVNYLTSLVVPLADLATHSLPVPLDLLLEGFPIATQGLILGGGVELCNALDLTLGF